MNLETRLHGGPPLLLDGALGTELERLGLGREAPVWSAAALVDAPATVRDIHERYLAAGAEIITAATFRTSRRALAKGGMAERAPALTRLAVQLAREARDTAARRPAWVAGSIAPLEDCYRPDLSPHPEIALAEHREMAEWLADAGADLLLVETMGNISEAAAALKAAAATGLPVWVSIICGAEGRALGGSSIAEAVAALEPAGAAALLINCTPATDVMAPLQELVARSSLPAGAYANMGMPLGHGGFQRFLSPEAYADAAAGWLRAGAGIIGGCCGTTPAHIRKLAALPAMAGQAPMQPGSRIAARRLR